MSIPLDKLIKILLSGSKLKLVVKFKLKDVFSPTKSVSGVSTMKYGICTDLNVSNPIEGSLDEQIPKPWEV
jgi:hypothetical protein